MICSLKIARIAFQKSTLIFPKNHPSLHAERPFDDPSFWDRVDRTPTCWNWTGALDRGYGVVKRHGRKQPARRYAWELVNGPVPNGKQLACTCCNRRCVRIEHMEVIEPGELQQRERRFA